MAVAYLDCEYNCAWNCCDLLEVGLVIVDKKKEIICEYGALVKPVAHGGKLSKYIVEFTGISQEEADTGISAEEVFDELYKRVSEYNVSEVYVYGSDDIPTLKKNEVLYASTAEAKNFIKLVQNIEPVINKAISVQESINLGHLAKICGYQAENVHRALDDARTLSYIHTAVLCGRFDKKTVRKIKKKNSIMRHYKGLLSAVQDFPELKDAVEKMGDTVRQTVSTELYIDWDNYLYQPGK